MRQFPVYIKHATDQMLAALKFAPIEDLEAVREVLIQAAKATVDLELAARHKAYKPEERSWRQLSERCPQCSDPLIANRDGTECSNLHCEYKAPDYPNPNPLDYIK